MKGAVSVDSLHYMQWLLKCAGVVQKVFALCCHRDCAVSGRKTQQPIDQALFRPAPHSCGAQSMWRYLEIKDTGSKQLCEGGPLWSVTVILIPNEMQYHETLQ